ncbi:MAG: hypothetical protein C0417_13125 [Chlorobiaceae bacterium]|nr:hypothetical protein [Chlorobiaceae bacterium]
MKYFTYIAFCTIIVIFGCTNNSNPSIGVLPESTFVAYFADSLILQETRRIVGMDSAVWNNKVDSVRSFHKCSIEEIESSHVFFRGNISRWDSLFSKVITRLEALQHSYIIKKEKTNQIK